MLKSTSVELTLWELISTLLQVYMVPFGFDVFLTMVGIGDFVILLKSKADYLTLTVLKCFCGFNTFTIINFYIYMNYHVDVNVWVLIDHFNNKNKNAKSTQKEQTSAKATGSLTQYKFRMVLRITTKIQSSAPCPNTHIVPTMPERSMNVKNCLLKLNVKTGVLWEQPDELYRNGLYIFIDMFFHHKLKLKFCWFNNFTIVI